MGEREKQLGTGRGRGKGHRKGRGEGEREEVKWEGKLILIGTFLTSHLICKLPTSWHGMNSMGVQDVGMLNVVVHIGGVNRIETLTVL